MTPVIVAVPVDGFVYIYYRDLAGGLHQTGQVLVGQAQPAELAQIVAELSDHLIWSKIIKVRSNGDEPVVDADTKASLTAPKRTRRASPDRVKRSYAEVAAFDDEILGIIAEHPGITIPAITDMMLHATDKNAQSSVRAGLDRLAKKGKVLKDTNVGRNESHRYSAVSTGHLDQDLPTGPTEEHSPSGG